MWFYISLVTAITVYLTRNKRYRWFYIIAKTYKRDLRALVGYARLNIEMWLWEKQNKTVPNIFSSLAVNHPDKIAFYFEDTAWTYTQAEEFANQVARYFSSQGFKKGDSVALLLENRHEYPCIWLGLSKLGVVTALINTNLTNDPLLHSINVAHCKGIIFGSNHVAAISTVEKDIKGLKRYQFHESSTTTKNILTNCTDLQNELSAVSKESWKENSQLNIKDPLIFIYTSGTTGLPKAAVITNIRFMYMATAFYCMASVKQSDIIYDPLPLYHTAGGMVGVGQTVLKGISLVIRKKFSASNYWKDCAKYNCTIAQYVGEICRYVLAAATDKPVKHSVKSICGNGMKPQIWDQFVKKFGIENVYEFYGATEGISNLINIDNTTGCVGFVPRYCKLIYPITLIKCNQTTGEAIRNADGYCIECDVNEPGLVIGKINPKKGLFSFKGYSDSKATEKKVLENVFRQGDMYFNSGDILEYDEFGSYFFKDRTGDTFRWKGENVSTTEIEAIISNNVQLNDAVVYGVEIPNTEGKAGMAAIVDTDNSIDIDVLSKGLKNNLPFYAIPIFLRIMRSVPITGTYKLKKLDLQLESYNINNIKDNIYYFNAKQGKYVPLTKDLYEQIMTSQISI